MDEHPGLTIFTSTYAMGCRPGKPCYPSKRKTNNPIILETKGDESGLGWPRAIPEATPGTSTSPNRFLLSPETSGSWPVTKEPDSGTDLKLDSLGKAHRVESTGAASSPDAGVQQVRSNNSMAGSSSPRWSRSQSISLTKIGSTWTRRGSLRRSASIPSRTLQPPASPNCRRISVERVALLAEKSFDAKEIETELQSLILTNREQLSTTTKVVLRESWEALSYESPASIGLLHLKVYMHASEVQTKYPHLGTSMGAKKTIDEACKLAHWRRTMDMIGVAITQLDNFESVAKIIRKIGARHTNIGVDDTVFIECYFAGLEYAFIKMLRFISPASHDKVWHHFVAILKSEFTLGWTRMRHDSFNYCTEPP